MTQKVKKLQTKEEKDALAQVEAYRAHVVNQELGAREAEAVWKKYYYTIEADKLVTEYNDVMTKNVEKYKEQQRQFEEFAKAAQVNNDLIEAGVDVYDEDPVEEPKPLIITS
jgi:hypothetical protein